MSNSSLTGSGTQTGVRVLQQMRLADTIQVQQHSRIAHQGPFSHLPTGFLQVVDRDLRYRNVIFRTQIQEQRSRHAVIFLAAAPEDSLPRTEKHQRRVEAHIARHLFRCPIEHTADFVRHMDRNRLIHPFTSQNLTVIRSHHMRLAWKTQAAAVPLRGEPCHTVEPLPSSHPRQRLEPFFQHLVAQARSPRTRQGSTWAAHRRQ